MRHSLMCWPGLGWFPEYKIQNPKGENVSSLHRLGNFTVRNEDIGNILDKGFHLSLSGRLPKKQFYLGHLGGVGWSQTCINQFCQIHGKSPNSIKLIGFRILNVWGVWVCPQFCVICPVFLGGFPYETLLGKVGCQKPSAPPASSPLPEHIRKVSARYLRSPGSHQ